MSQSLIPLGVGTILMKNTSYGGRESEEFRDMPSGPFRLDRVMITSVEEDVPVGHVDRLFETLRTCEMEIQIVLSSQAIVQSNPKSESIE